MTVRAVVPIGDPILRRPTDEVVPVDIRSHEVQQLIDDMIDTMRHASGAGIAANQIGVSKRITVIEVSDNQRYPYKPAIPLTVAINPRLTPLTDETVVINEGCLSVPLRGELERAIAVRVEYLDRDGRPHGIEAVGLTAGTWQHECDHLDGKMIVDRIDPTTFMTWEMYERYHRDAFVERITRFVDQT